MHMSAKQREQQYYNTQSVHKHGRDTSDQVRRRMVINLHIMSGISLTTEPTQGCPKAWTAARVDDPTSIFREVGLTCIIP